MPTKTEVQSVNIRMYRMGTGDFFILKFDSGFKMMIDCGCINARSEERFEPFITDLINYTDNEIDLLVVTHEHADHINGFQYASELLKKIQIKKLWLAWTEDKQDSFANDLRANHTKIKLALKMAGLKLNALKDQDYYSTFFADDPGKTEKIKNQKHFIAAVNELSDLNLFGADGEEIPTIEDLLKNKEIITKNTQIEFLSPGELHSNLENLYGIRFFILGPPRDNEALSLEHKKGHGYEKRKQKSQVNFSFVDALLNNENELSNPFDELYTCADTTTVGVRYNDPKNSWRQIEQDWLYSAGALAMRHETSINNTSLALAIQFIESEKVLLFPGDAEYGNWESWKDIRWTIEKGTIGIKYLLNNTVFYKVGHHMSQNGSGKEYGIEMMIQEEMAAMATLDLNPSKINSGWLNTMPNDLIGEVLINKTKGRLFFVGNAEDILRNIQTDRTSIKEANIQNYLSQNKSLDPLFIDYEVKV